jgi:hypothetical protein
MALHWLKKNHKLLTASSTNPRDPILEKILSVASTILCTVMQMMTLIIILGQFEPHSCDIALTLG